MTAQRQLHIAFYLQGVPINGNSVYTKPLGGTESAMIFMAAALARIGHKVEVFTETDSPSIYDDVKYRHWKEFEQAADKSDFDVLICIRSLLLVLAKRWAKLQVYFSPDAHDQPFVNSAMITRLEDGKNCYEIGLFSLKFVKNYIDVIFCVGQWQADTFKEKFSIPAEKLFVAGNGVDLKSFSLNNPLSKREQQIVYTSTPFRGLEYLLKYFPFIRQRVPDSKCIVMSGMQLYGHDSEQDRKAYGHIYDLADQPGVEFLGPLPKPEMNEILKKSRLLAYPNLFAETFCIAALEAQAAGLPVVTTKLAAMSERVADNVDGFLIPGNPNSQSYAGMFIDKCVLLLKDDNMWDEYSAAAFSKSRKFNYDELALLWNNEFFDKLENSKPDFLFIPEPQVVAILADGYPKKIELSARAMARHYITGLVEMGLTSCATLVSKRMV